jgi:hypothetical protein
MIRRGLTAATLAATALLPGGAGLALDGPGGPAGHTLAAPGPPVGDAAGIALARRANAYYARPARMAIEIRAPIDVGVMIIRGVLEHGRSHAAVGTFAVGPVRLRFVQTPSGFFTRLPGERCWRLDPEGIGDGAPFIAMRGSRFLAPRPIGGLVRLEVNEWDPDARARSRIAYKIDPASGRIASIIVDGEASTVRTLETAPRIPVPKPRCPDDD